MDYMYHMVPENMLGTVLYPLNRLKYVDRASYDNEAAKYRADPSRNRRDRRALMQRRVPILECLWNDVVHSSSVHPQALMDMWREAGYVPEKPLVVFEIPIEILDRERVVIYKHQSDYLKWMRWNYERYDPRTYEKYTHIPEKARATMKELVAKKQIWHYLHIPHVLYRGTIETTGLSVIAVHP